MRKEFPEKKNVLGMQNCRKCGEIREIFNSLVALVEVKEFPFYDEGEEKCYRCGNKLANIRDYGFPPGSGQFVGDCIRCDNHMTFFDYSKGGK